MTATIGADNPSTWVTTTMGIRKRGGYAEVPIRTVGFKNQGSSIPDTWPFHAPSKGVWVYPFEVRTPDRPC